MQRLWDHVDFAFQKNDHTAAELLLWPNGFQQYTPTPDDKLFEAYAGDDENPAIRGGFNPDGTWNPVPNRFDPDIGAELYITNGDLTDDAYAVRHPRLHAGGHRVGRPERVRLRVPGRRAADRGGVPAPSAVRARPRAFGGGPGQPDLAPRATRRRTSTSSRSRTPTATRSPCRSWPRSRSATSSMRYRINDGPVKTVNTAPFAGGERFDQEAGLYYHRLRGIVTGTSPGDEVEVWFDGARRSSSHFTYRARSETGNKVLLMAAENYTAGNPAYPDTLRPELPDLVHRRARRQRRRVRHLRRRPARQPLTRLARRAEPLRRRDLVPRRRQPDPPARAAARHRHRPGSPSRR